MASTRPRLTPDDWTSAALDAIREGGLAAVAVEPLAVRLGATKGSFYWHFANRDALVAAALVRWEQDSTEATIAALAAELDPVARLRRLFLLASERAGRDPLDVNLLAASDNALVAPTLRRVVERRLGYTIELFEQIGFPHTEAVRRGTFGYAAFTGHGDLMTRLPGALPIESCGGLLGYVEAVLALLLRDAPTPAA